MAQSKIINVFKKSSHKNTCSYIYTRDENGVFFFALCHKLAVNSRKRENPNANTGPAGTNDKYAGKFTSFGGGKKDSKHNLEASVSEIKDEANIPTLKSTDIHVSWMARTPCTPRTLSLVKACEINSDTVGFIYFIQDFDYFFSLFPQWPDARGGAEIVTSSCGEIDLVSSFTMDELSGSQKYEISESKNNFVTSYCANTLNKFVIPFISEQSEEFKKRWFNGIEVGEDTGPREVCTKPLYTEVRPGVYV